MRYEFQRTEEDIQQANAAYRVWATRAGESTLKGSYLVAVAVLVILGALSVAFTWMKTVHEHQPPIVWVVDPVVFVGLVMVMPMLIGWGLLSGWNQQFKSPKPGVITLDWAKVAKPDKGFRKRGAGGWIAFVVLAAMLLFLLQRPRPATAPAVPSTLQTLEQQDEVMGYMPMALIISVPWLVLFIVVAKFQKIGTKIRLMEMNQNQFRPTRFDFDENSVFFENEVYSARLAFSGFVRFLENEKLLLLQESSAIYHLIPKRAFSDPADLQRFKSLLIKHVSTGILAEEPVFGFAVIAPKSQEKPQ